MVEVYRFLKHSRVIPASDMLHEGDAFVRYSFWLEEIRSSTLKNELDEVEMMAVSLRSIIRRGIRYG